MYVYDKIAKLLVCICTNIYNIYICIIYYQIIIILNVVENTQVLPI